MKSVFLLFISLLNVFKIIQSVQYLPNPCPNYFRYHREGYVTYGIIEVPPIELGKNLRINVELSLKGGLPNNYYGSLELLGKKAAALQSILYGRAIRYKINFPLQHTLPVLTKIYYNGHLICSGPPEQGYTTDIQLEHTLRTENSLDLVVLPNGTISVAPPPGATTEMTSVSDRYEKVTENPVEMSTQASTTTTSTTTGSSTTTSTTTTTVKPTTPGSLEELLAELYGPHSEFMPNATTTTTTTELPETEITDIREEEEICGKPVPAGNTLVLNGSPTIRGEFPWLIAIFKKKTKTLEFHCGGTLITKRVILTSAHCFHLNTDDILTANDVVLFAGRNDIDDWTETGYVSPKIKTIVMHPDYKKNDEHSSDADIAIIALKQKIKFTQYIRPACLWHGDIKFSEIVSKTGTVAGWGRDRGGIITSTPNKVEMPIVSESTCLRSHESYRFLTSNRTFCAGKRDGSGPCNGDSGGGFTMFKDERWYVRGVVSTSLYDLNTSSCDVKNYVVFTDVAQFLPWIVSYL